VGQITKALGNVTVPERPFHPTTLVSVVKSGLRGRQRQLECRRLNEELELRVEERTDEIASDNRQLLAQIEERERAGSTLRRVQRLEAVGQLTSGVTHDFNNLLTVVLGNIRFLERDLARASIDGRTMDRLRYIRTAAERGAKLTTRMPREVHAPCASDSSCDWLRGQNRSQVRRAAHSVNNFVRQQAPVVVTA
jgi:C4-dicarboxylate-specific signal transduction histidine kinase